MWPIVHSWPRYDQEACERGWQLTWSVGWRLVALGWHIDTFPHERTVTLLLGPVSVGIWRWQR